MDPYRTNKLNQSILEVLSQLLTVSVKDPRVGMVTINDVEVSKDLGHAKVFFSVLGNESDAQASARRRSSSSAGVASSSAGPPICHVVNCASGRAIKTITGSSIWRISQP